MTFKFKRKRLLLSEKNKSTKVIGYARATHNEYEYLEKQINNLFEVVTWIMIFSIIDGLIKFISFFDFYWVGFIF